MKKYSLHLTDDEFYSLRIMFDSMRGLLVMGSKLIQQYPYTKTEYRIEILRWILDRAHEI